MFFILYAGFGVACKPTLQNIGPKVAQSVIDYFADPDNRALDERLKTSGLRLESEAPTQNDGKFNDLSFVISGTFTAFMRDELKNTIERNGGKNLNGVSVNPENNDVFVMVSQSATTTGQLFIYDKMGSLTGTYDTGIAPGWALFVELQVLHRLIDETSPRINFGDLSCRIAEGYLILTQQIIIQMKGC